MESSRTGKTMLLEVKFMIFLDWEKPVEGTCVRSGVGGAGSALLLEMGASCTGVFSL